MASITCTDGYIGEAVTIRLAKPVSGVYKYTLEYAFGDTNGTIATKVSANNSPVSWVLPEDFYYQLPNSTSGTGQVLYTIYDAENNYVSDGYVDFKVMVPDNPTSRPTFTVSFKEMDAKVSALTNMGVKYVSDIQYTVNATGYKGASIVSYRVQNGQDVLTTKTGTFYNVASTEYQVIVTDSRGITNSTIYTYALNNYTRLTCNLTLDEVDPEEGSFTLTVDGNYHSGNFGSINSQNTLSVYVNLVDKDNNTTKLVASPRWVGTTYTATVTFEGINYLDVYEATAFASDRLTDVQSRTVLCVGKPIFDWSNEDFRFNIPISSIGGYNFADFVIETGETAMGTNGTWYWRKWKSGRAECTGCRNFGKYSTSVTTTSNWELWAHGPALTQAFPTGLFIDTPEVIDMRLRATGNADTPPAYTGWVGVIGEHEAGNDVPALPSKDNTGTFAIYHPSVQNFLYPATFVSFNVIGRWK